MARPTLFNENRKRRFLDAIRQGDSFRAASACAGVNHQTVYKWLKKAEGRDAPSEFVVFLDEYKAAVGEAEDYYVSKLKAAADQGNTTAAIFMLKSINRERYGDQQRVETRDRTGEPEEVSEDELIRRMYGRPEAVEHIHALIELVDVKPRNVGKRDKPEAVDDAASLEALR
ncbi:MAG: hypothetical protein A4E31_00137 [Methanomassiliicoccales archaeon PtaU1.Bin030]|nr:MAG: hypothetical protein A4E31_00137 [Methanomassiliicoccales archaeon PtaU1.Bin030]